MAKSLEDHKRVLTFETNEVWESVQAFLGASIDAEVDRAIAYSTEGEKRIHACGRAESLKDFRDMLLSLQQEARDGKYRS
jgi:hypothetical protein